MDAQEGRPGLTGRARRSRAAAVLLDRPLADPNPELAQLALDALGAPEMLFWLSRD
jgi:hypothetical protein